jgi:hypothetical protein
MQEYYVTLFCAGVVALPILFPKVFWNQNDKKTTKVVYYNISKFCDNPFADEPTRVTLYDPDTKSTVLAQNIYDNDQYDQVAALLESYGKTYDHLFFVTYEITNKSTCFKLLFEDIFEQYKGKPAFFNLRNAAYALDTSLPHIKYEELLDHYDVPKSKDRTHEYCAIFEKMIENYDVASGQSVQSKYMLLHQHVCPLEDAF